MKPLYSDHLWATKKVVLIGRWSLYRGLHQLLRQDKWRSDRAYWATKPCTTRLPTTSSNPKSWGHKDLECTTPRLWKGLVISCGIWYDPKHTHTLDWFLNKLRSPLRIGSVIDTTSKEPRDQISIIQEVMNVIRTYIGAPDVIEDLSDGDRALVDSVAQPIPKLWHPGEIPVLLQAVRLIGWTAQHKP